MAITVVSGQQLTSGTATLSTTVSTTVGDLLVLFLSIDGYYASPPTINSPWTILDYRSFSGGTSSQSILIVATVATSASTSISFDRGASEVWAGRLTILRGHGVVDVSTDILRASSPLSSTGNTSSATFASVTGLSATTKYYGLSAVTLSNASSTTSTPASGWTVYRATAGTTTSGSALLAGEQNVSLGSTTLASGAQPWSTSSSWHSALLAIPEPVSVAHSASGTIAVLSAVTPGVVTPPLLRFFDTASVISAINAAQTMTSLKAALAPLSAAYSVDFQIMDEGGYFRTTYHADPISVSDPRLKPVLRALADEISKYPTTFLEPLNLDKLVIVKNLGRDVPDALDDYGGTAAPGQVHIDMDGSNYFTRDRQVLDDGLDGFSFILHHEIAHSIFQFTYPEMVTPSSSWTDALPPNFVYGNTTEDFDGDHPRGFTRPYAKLRYNEDVADLWGFMMSSLGSSRLKTWVQYDTKLNDKRELVKQFMGTKNAQMGTEGYYDGIHSGFTPRALPSGTWSEAARNLATNPRAQTLDGGGVPVGFSADGTNLTISSTGGYAFETERAVRFTRSTTSQASYRLAGASPLVTFTPGQLYTILFSGITYDRSDNKTFTPYMRPNPASSTNQIDMGTSTLIDNRITDEREQFTSTGTTYGLTLTSGGTSGEIVDFGKIGYFLGDYQGEWFDGDSTSWLGENYRTAWAGTPHASESYLERLNSFWANGVVYPQTSVSGAMSKSSSISGSVVATSATVGNVVKTFALSGTSVVVAFSSGSLYKVASASGSVTAVSAASGAPLTARPISGASSAVSTTSGSLFKTLLVRTPDAPYSDDIEVANPYADIAPFVGAYGRAMSLTARSGSYVIDAHVSPGNIGIASLPRLYAPSVEYSVWIRPVFGLMYDYTAGISLAEPGTGPTQRSSIFFINHTSGTFQVSLYGSSLSSQTFSYPFESWLRLSLSWDGASFTGRLFDASGNSLVTLGPTPPSGPITYAAEPRLYASNASGAMGTFAWLDDVYVSGATGSAVSTTSGSVNRYSSVDGSVSALSAATGALTKVAPVIGRVDSFSSNVGSPTLRGAVNGRADAVSLTSGLVLYRALASGSVSAISVVSGSPRAAFAPTATVASVSTISGQVSLTGAARGASASVGASLGAATARLVAQGASAAVSTTLGSLTSSGLPSGRVDAVSSISGTATPAGSIIGTVTAVSASQATVAKRTSSSGASAAISTVSGYPTARVLSSATVAATSASIGALAAQSSASGSVDVLSASAGQVSASLISQATVSASSATAGDAQNGLTSAASAVSGTVGAVTSRRQVAGAVGAVSSTSGSPGVGLRGSVDAVSTLAGAVTRVTRVTGQSVSISSTSGASNVGASAQGTVSSASATSGVLSGASASGAVMAASATLGYISRRTAVAGVASASSDTAGLVSVGISALGSIGILSDTDGSVSQIAVLYGIVAAISASSGIASNAGLPTVPAILVLKGFAETHTLIGSGAGYTLQSFTQESTLYGVPGGLTLKAR